MIDWEANVTEKKDSHYYKGWKTYGKRKRPYPMFVTKIVKKKRKKKKKKEGTAIAIYAFTTFHQPNAKHAPVQSPPVSLKSHIPPAWHLPRLVVLEEIL
jgi:hypothetical protein